MTADALDRAAIVLVLLVGLIPFALLAWGSLRLLWFLLLDLLSCLAWALLLPLRFAWWIVKPPGRAIRPGPVPPTGRGAAP